MNTANLQVYNKSEVASHYAVLSYLTPCERLLFDLYVKPGGVFLFSSHNPRSIFVRPTWNQKRIEALRQACSQRVGFLSKPVSIAMSLGVRTRAWLRAAWESIARVTTRVPRRAFWRGEGYLVEG